MSSWLQGTETVSARAIAAIVSASLMALLGACGGGGGGSSNTAHAPGSVQMSAAVYEATEGTVLNIPVTRSGGAAGAASVDYTATAVTAIGGLDFAAVGGTLSWPDNISGNRTISIRLPDDAEAESTESFTVTLSHSVGASLGANASATVTIIDDDSTSLAAYGIVSSTGSITVNGIRYDSDGATVTINAQPGEASDLKPGQLVSLRGDANLSTGIGSAASINHDSTVIGPVEHVDVDERRLLVIGQTIVMADDTVFGDQIDADTLVGLTAGAGVQIDGFANHLGEIIAARVELDPGATQVQLTGTVQALDPQNGLFSVNRILVDFSAVPIALSGGQLANGQRVIIRGVLNGGTLVAETITAIRDLLFPPGEIVQMSGLVTRFESPAEFHVNSLPVAANVSTRFFNGATADLQLDSRVLVQGRFGADPDPLMIDELVFGLPESPRSTASYDFDGFTRITVSGLATVVVRQGIDYNVDVFGAPGSVDELSVTQDGDTVSLGNDTTTIFHAVVTLPVLRSIAVQTRSLAHVSLEGFSQMQMTIRLDGVSALRAEDLAVADLTVGVSGVSFLDLGTSQPITSALIDIDGVSTAVLNMDQGSSISGSVRTGQGTGVSRLLYFGTDVSVDVTTDSVSEVVRLGDTRVP